MSRLAPHIHDVFRLRLVCVTVETTSNDIAQRGKVFLMLESAPNYIDRPVNMGFMPSPSREKTRVASPNRSSCARTNIGL